MQHDQEFYVSAVILTDGDVSIILYGGVTFVLLIVTIWFLAIRWKTKKKIDEHTIVKKLFDEKERKNGKAGSHGHY